MTQLGSIAVLDRLAHVSVRRDVPSLGDRLAALDRWVRDDLATLERDLTAIPRGACVIHAAAHHRAVHAVKHRPQETIMIEIRRILCPIDFSDYSRRALDHAIAIARWYESTVTVLHVFPTAPAVAVGPGPAVFDPILLSPIERDKLLADTKAFAAAERPHDIPIKAVVRFGGCRHPWTRGVRARPAWIGCGTGAPEGQLPRHDGSEPASGCRAHRPRPL